VRILQINRFRIGVLNYLVNIAKTPRREKDDVMTSETLRLTDLEIAALVAVAQAHGIRTQARRSARQLKAAFDTAQSNLRIATSSARSFGHYDDCGPGYNEELTNDKGAFASVEPLFEQAKQAEIAAEMDYTRIKKEAIGQYPSLEPTIVKLISSSNAVAAVAVPD
jgi:hypothetical protein